MYWYAFKFKNNYLINGENVWNLKNRENGIAFKIKMLLFKYLWYESSNAFGQHCFKVSEIHFYFKSGL